MTVARIEACWIEGRLEVSSNREVVRTDTGLPLPWPNKSNVHLVSWNMHRCTHGFWMVDLD